MSLLVGCAGWSLPKDRITSFPLTGTHLQRYASQFNAVEINSSFYRPHRKSTYQRWADSTPSDFRFSVKLPKQISHLNRLADSELELDQFLDETSGLGAKLGAILVQLPPSLNFKVAIMERFFRELRGRTDTPIVCEPRHATWFGTEAEYLLIEYAIDRAAADPSVVPKAADPGGAAKNLYFRWHGSPRMYYSAYDQTALHQLATRVLARAGLLNDAWCIFDNTAIGAAIDNASTFREIVKHLG